MLRLCEPDSCSNHRGKRTAIKKRPRTPYFLPPNGSRDTVQCLLEKSCSSVLQPGRNLHCWSCIRGPTSAVSSSEAVVCKTSVTGAQPPVPLLKNRNRHLDLPIQRRCPRPPSNVTETCQPRQSLHIRRLEVIRTDLIYPQHLTTSVMSAWVSDNSPTESSASAPSVEGATDLGDPQSNLSLPTSVPSPSQQLISSVHHRVRGLPL